MVRTPKFHEALIEKKKKKINEALKDSDGEGPQVRKIWHCHNDAPRQTAHKIVVIPGFDLPFPAQVC